MIAPTRERVERKLEKSGRITPREVLEAYEETGLKPCEGQFLSGNRACALGVLRLYADPSCKYHVQYMRTRMPQQNPVSYASGFTNGFDGTGTQRQSIGYLKGYRDGQRVRRFVLARLGV
jgi:hypothetical protein